MEDKLITIAEYTDTIQADIDKQFLEDFGIKAVVINQNAANDCLAPTLMLVKLQVLESDAAKAAQILEPVQAEHNVDEAGDIEELDGLEEEEQ